MKIVRISAESMSRQQSTKNERYLLDALDRISKNSYGYAVLYVSISKLKPKHRHPDFVKILARLFDSVVGNARGYFFIMSNGDFVILGKNITQETVDEAVAKLRQGLSADPILHGKDSSEFATVFEFPANFAAFYKYVEEMLESDIQHNDADVLLLKRPVEANEIDSVIAELDDIDIAELVKRQSVIKIKGGGKFEVMFQEFFVAVKDLSLQFDRNLDLVANRWLFLYLTQALDKKTLSAFSTAELQKWSQQISLNLNLSSVFSSEFVDFARNFLKPEQKVLVEVQLMDVFNNLPLYFEAKEILHKGGHKLLLDAVSPSALRMLNLKTLQPDMVKLFWEPLLEYEAFDEKLKAIIDTIGRENFVLAKCDSDKALKWGVSYGITAFQGPFMDDIEVAVVRSRCPSAGACTAQQCLKRRRLLSGTVKAGCAHPEVLEDLL